MNEGARRTLWRSLGVAICVAFVALVQVYIGWGKLLAPWRTMPAAQLVPAVGLVLASLVLRAVRVYDYFAPRLHAGFGLCFKLVLQHNLCNNLLPARTGEVSFPVLMSRFFGVPARESVPVLVWFRVLDLFVLAGCALLFAGGLWMHAGLAIVLGSMLLGAPWLLFRLQDALASRLRAHRGRLARFGQAALAGTTMQESRFWRAWSWTLANWLVKVAAFAWILRLFVDVPLRAASVGVIAGDLTSVLPFHALAGAGTYETGVVAGLRPAGVPLELALRGAVNLHLFLLGTTVLGGALSLGVGGRRALAPERIAAD